MKKKKFLGSLLAVVILLLASFFGLDVDIPEAAEPAPPSQSAQETVDRSTELLAPDGSFTTKEDVALYIHTYGCPPPSQPRSRASSLVMKLGGRQP